MTKGEKAAGYRLHGCAGNDRLLMQFSCAANDMLLHRDSHMHEIVQSLEFSTREGLAIKNAKILVDFSQCSWLS